MNILVVEDDRKIESFLDKGLSSLGHTVDSAHSAEAADENCAVREFDVVIVDLMLPGMSGEDLIRSFRARGNKTPILVLSAKQSVDERVEGLRAGADDYLTKPFAFAELVERLRALERRSGYVEYDDRITIEDLEIDSRTRTAVRNGSRLDLWPREFALLELLARNRGNIIPKAIILERVWNFDFDPQTNVVGVLVHRLRKKVDEPFERKLIRTVRGVGYMIPRNEE